MDAGVIADLAVQGCAFSVIDSTMQLAGQNQPSDNAQETQGASLMPFALRVSHSLALLLATAPAPAVASPIEPATDTRIAAMGQVANAAPALAQKAPSRVFGLEDFQNAFTAVPCEDKERLAGVKTLFEQAGAPPSDVTVDQYENVENLVVIKRGASAEKIVIGAHYDKVAQGCGAVDNWTGVVALSSLYQTLRDIPLKKTLVFVAFGREEKGLVGSRAMTRAIPDGQVADYCAMINIDSLGMGPPQVADNMSSKKLARFTGALAKEMEIPFDHASIRRANSDSSSFVAKRIPAVTIHGMNNQWASVLHSRYDQPEKVNAASVYLGYRLALLAVVRLDALPCAAHR